MKILSLTLNCFRIEEMRNFYSLLGADFSPYKVLLGSQGYRGNFQGLEVNLLPAEKIFASILKDNKQLSLPAYQISLNVAEIKRVIEKLQKQFPTSVLSDVIEDANGSFVLLEDPQGNKVELIETKK